MTKEEAKQTALRWLDEATAGGQMLEEESTADLLERMDHLLAGAVAAVCGRFPHHTMYSVPCCPPRNLLGMTSGSQRLWSPARYQVSTPPFYTYTLEVQGRVTLTLQAKGKTVLTKTADTPGAYTRLCGVLPQPADTLCVQGQGLFIVNAVGLYPDIYPADDIPDWQPYWSVAMPEDFSALEEVLYSGDGLRFSKFSDYRRLGNKHFGVPRQLTGQLDFYYIRNPQLPAPAAKGDTVLDVQPAAACLVPLRLAADLTVGVDETAALSSYLNARYNDLASTLYRRPDPERGTVECIYAQ